MTDDRPTRPGGADARFAPWWVYLLTILGANYLRAWVLPPESLTAVLDVVIAVAQALVLFVVITVVWRVARRP